jgi:hypothetical protein
MFRLRDRTYFQQRGTKFLKFLGGNVMSITITVGNKPHTIEGDGAIDTKPEAEAALTVLGSNDKLTANGKDYTREELVAIRDQKTSSDAKDGTTSAPGMANGVQLTGYYAGAGGDKGHSGGGLRLSWVPSWLIGGDRYTTHFDLPTGIDVGHFNKDYTLPGGGDANSAFTRYGLRIAPTVRLVPPWLGRILSGSIGLGFGAGGFSTADSNMVSTPPSCTPDDFGRTECKEPSAGPRTGNAGTAGLLYPRIGSSRGTEGAYFDFGVPITLGVNIARGAWGSIGAFAGFEPGYTHLMPKDGGAFGFARYMGFLGFGGSFGGSAVEKLRKTETPPPPPAVPDHAPAITRTAGEAMTLADDAAVRALGGLSADAKILGVQFDKLPEDTSAPYEIPASAMTPGAHEIKIRYRNPGDTADRIKIVPLTVGEPAKVSDNGASYGAVLNMPATAVRLAPDTVGGVPVERPVPVGNVQTTADFPANSTYQLYVDGNPVGKPQALPADRNTPLSLPASVSNGPHQVQLRVMRPNQTTVIYPTVNVAVGPATVTITKAEPQPRPPAPEYSYTTASLVVDIDSSGEAKESRIRAGGKVLWSGSLHKGSNSVTVIEKGGARENYSGALIIEQKNGADWVEVGKTRSVEIKKAGGGGYAPAKPKVKL